MATRTFSLSLVTRWVDCSVTAERTPLPDVTARADTVSHGIPPLVVADPETMRELGLNGIAILGRRSSTRMLSPPTVILRLVVVKVDDNAATIGPSACLGM